MRLSNVITVKAKQDLFGLDTIPLEQIVFVVNSNAFYYLKDWSRRNKTDGWKIVNSTTIQGKTVTTIGGGGGSIDGSLYVKYQEAFITDPSTAPDQIIYGNIEIHGNITATGEISAFTETAPSGSFWDTLPWATPTVLGGIKYDPDIFEKNGSDQLTISAGIFAPILHYHNWSDITSGLPTTLSGYGITDGANTYTNATPTAIPIFGIATGSTFSGKTMQEMWDNLLYPYQVPYFTAFGLSGFTSILECGINFTGGSQTFTWSISNSGNVTANTVAIRDITNTTDLATGLANDGTEAITLTAGTQTSNGATRQWGIRATDSQTNQIGYVYLTTYFYSPIYIGVGASGMSVADLQQFSGLGKRVTGEVSFTYSFTTSSNKMYICYPAAWGYLTSVKDSSFIDITADFGTPTTQSFTYQSGYYNGTTVSYYVYEFVNNSTVTNYLVTFNF